MKKQITSLFFIFFISFLFSDTIKYREKKLFGDYKDRVVTDVEFLGVSKEGVHYQYSIKYLGNVSKTINCYDVYEILDNDKNSISYSCSEITYDPMNEEQVTSEAKSNVGEVRYRRRVGGLLIAIGAGLGAGLVTIGAGIGIGKITAAAAEATGRQPEAAGDIRTTALIMSALIEGVALFCAVTCFLLSGNVG